MKRKLKAMWIKHLVIPASWNSQSFRICKQEQVIGREPDKMNYCLEQSHLQTQTNESTHKN